MNLLRWGRTWDPLRDLSQEVDRFIRQTIGPIGVPRPFRPQYPALNAYSQADQFIVTAQLPGVKLEDVDLTITGDTLTIRGSRKAVEGVGDDQYRRQERPVGVWQRQVVLPDEVEAAEARAHLANGILTVRVPKSEKALPKQVPVTVAVD